MPSFRVRSQSCTNMLQMIHMSDLPLTWRAAPPLTCCAHPLPHNQPPACRASALPSQLLGEYTRPFTHAHFLPRPHREERLQADGDRPWSVENGSLPLIFAGGPTATSNPEPFSAFCDYFALVRDSAEENAEARSQCHCDLPPFALSLAPKPAACEKSQYLGSGLPRQLLTCISPVAPWHRLPQGDGEDCLPEIGKVLQAAKAAGLNRCAALRAGLPILPPHVSAPAYRLVC